MTPSPAVTPSPSATPSKPGAPPSPAGQGAPSSETATSTPPSIPKSVPDRTLLTRSDGEVENLTRLGEGRSGPRLCSAASYPSAAVRKCPQGERGDSTFTYSSLGSLGSLGVGDESLLVRGTAPARGDDGELSEDGSKYVVYLSAVRIGDAVSLVETDGYESVPAEHGDAEGFARKAAQRLADWRD